MLSLPQTTHEVYIWNAALLAVYSIVAYALEGLYRHVFAAPRSTGLRPPDYLFNGATFSASVMLGFGIYDEKVLHLIGDTTGYLTSAGFAGFGYSILALTPKKRRGEP